jgi:hypothetical protein
MTDPALQPAPSAQYLAAVERHEEMARLHSQAQLRKSMLVFGVEGVGKSRLLQTFVSTHPLALYAGQTASPRILLLGLIQELRRVSNSALQLPSDPASLGAPSLKGIVQRALDKHPFLLVLDQLSNPSRIVTRMIKEMHYLGRTPVFFAARTPHMEDIGALQPMCAERSEKLELKSLPFPIALEFAQREAAGADLQASNLEQALHSIVEWSEGNPGAILAMLKMADSSQYRMGDQIKAHVLYLDFRMGRR